MMAFGGLEVGCERVVGFLGGGLERKCASASWVVRIGCVRLMSREAKLFESRPSFESPVPGGCKKLENDCLLD